MEAHRARPRILLVDNDDACLRALARMLEGAGLVVVACGSAAEGVAALEGGVVDVVFVDLCDGGGRSGAAFLRRIRCNPRTAAIPVVAMSGGDPGDLNLCLDEGADAVLEKPFTIARFLVAFNEAELGRRWSISFGSTGAGSDGRHGRPNPRQSRLIDEPR